MLSREEHVEHLRALAAGQRLAYTLVLSLIVAAAFVGSVGLAVAIAIVLFMLIGGSAPTAEDVVTLGVPIILAFLAAIGFTSNPRVHGETVRQAARRAARFGLVNGFVTGAIFGVVWSIIAGLTAVRFERWDLIFRQEVVLFGLALGIAVSPALAIYRAVTSVVEAVVLNVVSRSQAA